MVKVVVLYGPPSDPESFEDYYANTHMPLVAKMPSVRRAEASRVVATPDGDAPAYYRVFEAWFDSHEDFQGSFGSAEGQAAVADVGNFATGGATILVTEVD